MTTLVAVMVLVGVILVVCLDNWFDNVEQLNMQKRQQTDQNSIIAERQKTDLEKSQLNAFTRHIKQHNKLVVEYRRRYVAELERVIKKHYKTLETKYEQVMVSDDYGYTDVQDFLPEFNYFFNKVLLHEAPPFFFDASIEADPKLWNSYESLSDEYLSLPSHLQVQEKDEYTWRWETFFCFRLKFKKVEGLTVNNTQTKASLNIACTFSTVEYSFTEKDSIFELNFEERQAMLMTQIRDIALSIFNNLRIMQTILADTVTQSVGVKIKRTAPDNPLEYENYVAVCLKDLGFKARSTKASGDQGADVLAEKNGISFAIQCKKYSKPVGNKAVQEANAGRDFYKCDYGVVVSNAGFTKSAKQAANACKIILLNDRQLEKLLEYIPDGECIE